MKKLQQLIHTFAIVLLVGVLSFGSMQSAQATPTDSELLKQGVIQWSQGWSAGDAIFTMNRVDNLYDHSDRFLEFDTLSPASTVTQSYQGFQDLWEPTMQASTKAKTQLDNNVQVTTDGKMGLTTFTFQTEYTDRKSSKKYAEHAHASMIWEKQDGRWVIIHEHVSSPVRAS
jgi:ketosteroid isomerase-like protein